MTRAELLSVMLSRLGRIGDTALSAQLQTELDFIQETKLEGHEWLPWFLLTMSMEEEETVADTEYIDLPSDFLMLDDEEESAVFLYQSGEDEPYTELKRDGDAFLRAKNLESDTPESYAIVGTRLYLFPTPDDEYTIRYRYFAKDDLPSVGDGNNQWMKYGRDVLMYETLSVAARELLKDDAAAAGFEARAVEAWRRLYKRHVSQQEAGRKRSMGDD